MADSAFDVTLSARITQRYTHTFTIEKSDFYTWLESYTKVDPYDPENDWEDLVNQYCEEYWDSLVDYPDYNSWDYRSDNEELTIEGDVDLTLKQPHEVQLHQETKLW